MLPRPLALLTVLALTTLPGSATAGTIYFIGNGGSGSDPVSYSGKIDVTAAGSGTSATINVTLTNTTSIGDAVNYGFITGFGINVPSLNITSASGTSTDADFKFLTRAANTTSLQGGEFDYAFSTNSSQLHTVNDSQIPLGLGAGQSATFTITLGGTGLSGLTAQQISQELSASPGVPFSVRFRSTNDYKYPGQAPPDGDKVPFTVVAAPSSVPAPAGLVLGLIGAGCFLGRNIRRRFAVKS